MSPHTGNAWAPVSTRSGADYWLGQLHSTRGLPPAELQDVLTSWEDEFRYNPNTSNRIKIALLLAYSDKPVRNIKRARQIMVNIDTATIEPGDRELVTILQQHIKASQEIDTLSGRTRQDKKRIEELEQQLLDLTSIEQTIQQRDKSIDE
ncbi:MAG: hypothetical protein ABFS22_01040 [Pseudomonadota bacterium]